MPPVSLEDHGPVGHDLAHLAGGQFLQRLWVDDAAVHAVDRYAQALQLGPFRRVAVAGRGGFRQPVAFGEGQAKLGLQALGHRKRHGRATPADVAQAAEIEALVVGAGEEIDDHRRNAGPVRHPVAADGAAGEFTVPARQDDDGAAQVDAAKHAVHHACYVKHRHHRQAGGLGTGVAPQTTAHGVGHQRAVRVHATLGQAGGAAGVGQQRHVVRLGHTGPGAVAGGQGVGPARGLKCESRRTFRQRVFGRQPCQHRRGWCVFRRQRVGHGVGKTRYQQMRQLLLRWQAGTGFGHRGGQVGGGDGDACARVCDVVAELVGAVHRIHRHHHGVGALHGIEGHQILRAVLHVQQHTVAALHALGLEPARQGLGQAVQFAITQRAAQVNANRLVRVTPGTDLEVEPQRGFGHDQFTRQT